MRNIREIADAADVIVNGYAYTKDGENIRVLKQNIFTCSTTLVPQIGQILRWRRPTGDGNYVYYSGIITKVDIPLYQLRSLSVQIDDTEEIIIHKKIIPRTNGPSCWIRQ